MGRDDQPIKKPIKTNQSERLENVDFMGKIELFHVVRFPSGPLKKAPFLRNVI